MKKLIISSDVYSWLYEFYDIINVDNYDIIIVCNDNISVKYSELCYDAIREQRKFDLFKIGKKLNISKITNLDYYSGNIDEYRLAFQLKFYIAVNGIKDVYCSNISVLKNILNKFDKISVIYADKINKLPYDIEGLVIGK
jgi:hypothetical protein